MISKNRKTGNKNTVFDNRITENVDYKNWYEYGWCYICVFSFMIHSISIETYTFLITDSFHTRNNP